MFKNVALAGAMLRTSFVRGSRQHGGGAGITPQHRVSAYDQFVLRVTRTVREPVTQVSLEKMEKANSRFRIGLMFVMMAFCLAGSGYAVYQGKRDAREHMNLAQKNRDRHRNAKEQ